MHWTAEDGTLLRLGASRARALARVGQDRGATGFAGVPLGCPGCAAPAIAARIGALARSARCVGAVRDGTRRYPVFATRNPHVRLLTHPLRDGSHEILTVSVAPLAAHPPSYLGEVDLRELQYDVRVLPMKTRVVWIKEPLTQAQIDERYKGQRSHLVYIPVNDKGMPLKVGESTQLNNEPGAGRPRYFPGEAAAKGAQKFYVGRVVDDKGNTLAGKHVIDAQNVVARKLDRMGVPLPEHGRKNKGGGRSPQQKVYTDDGSKISVKSAIPKHLQQHLAKHAPPQTKVQKQAAKTRTATVHGKKAYELSGGSGGRW